MQRGYAVAQSGINVLILHIMLVLMRKKCCINAPNVFCRIDRMEIMLYTCIMNKGNEEMNKSNSNPAK